MQIYFHTSKLAVRGTSISIGNGARGEAIVNPIFRSIPSLLEIKIATEGKKSKREVPRFLVSIYGRATHNRCTLWDVGMYFTRYGELLAAELQLAGVDSAIFEFPRCCCNWCPYPWQLSLILTDDVSLFDGYFSHFDCSPCCAVIYRLHLALLNRSSPADVPETRCTQSELLFVVEDRANGRNVTLGSPSSAVVNLNYEATIQLA
ncbi:hypothetical protein K0M31_008968 [Melipona bicolor]|uniref:Uncharacterized protein n=1 Tax=Melipona bicolor TaxID=60889 RepID=A0AA40KJL6_9HYME|nr:hypothetical protein K0M31_008968 [Melipona bicolor]